METIQQAIDLLDNIHTDLARSSLSKPEYNSLSGKIINVKQFLRTQKDTNKKYTNMTFDTSYDPPHNTDAYDHNGKMIAFGDSLLLTFNKGTYQEHSAEYDVIWYRGAFCIRSKTGKIAPLQSISNSVEVIK